jgi:hypothetical protein
MDVEDSLDRAYALGVKNREILTLLNRHCALARDEKTGGRGMAEAASGLPIDMRTIRCEYAKNPCGSANNLEWIVVDFYRANCVGCPHRQLRDLPNLATYVAELDEEAKRKAEADGRRREEIARRRKERSDQRTALAVREPAAAANLLDDLDVIDGITPTQSDAEEDHERAARDRIRETAVHAPETFTPVVINQLRQLVLQPNHAWLFDILSHLTSSGRADGRDTLELALSVLTTNATGEAAAVLLAQRAHLADGDLSRPVLRSLVLLAGTPELHGLALAYGRGRSRDARGLMVAVDEALHGLLDTLASMLLDGQVRSEGERKSPLWLPPGAVPRDPSADDYQRDNERASAAVAARRVLTAVPGTGGILARQLLDSLKIPDAADYGASPKFEVTETLARLLLEQPTVVMPLIVEAGGPAQGNFSERLMDVAERAAHRLRFLQEKISDSDTDIEDIDRVGDYPEYRLGPVALPAVAEVLFGFALDRLAGDWGERVAGDAGRLITELVGAHPEALMAGGKGIYAVIGHLIEASSRGSVDSSAVVASSPSAGLELIIARQTQASQMGNLRRALGSFANVDVNAVLDAVEPLLDAPILTPDPVGQPAESNTQAGGTSPPLPHPDAAAQVGVRVELLELLGALAQSHGLVPGVLHRILPRLTTHLIAGDPVMRGTAIRALADAYRSEQQLPSTFSDLLPALLGDPYVVVIRALLEVLPSLVYRTGCIDDQHLPLIIRWAVLVEPEVCSNSQHDVENVISVLRAVASRYEEPVKVQLLTAAFAFGKDLPSYDVKDHLETHWPGPVAQSAAFAELCVRAIQDPDTRDESGDVLLLLLDAWPGANRLALEQITALADLTPSQYPFAAADYVELLGRLGRHAEAAVLARHILDRVAPVPANDAARAIATAVCCAAEVEAAIAALAANSASRNGAPKPLLPDPEVRRAETSIDALRGELDRPERARFGLDLPRHAGPADRMLATVAARCAAVRALSPLTLGALGADDGDGAADACEAAAASLRGAYPQDLPTADAHRFYADALEIIGCVVRADVATQRAEGAKADSQIQAAHRRGTVLAEQVGSRQTHGGVDPSDPLWAGLMGYFAHAEGAAIGEIPQLSRELLVIALPIRVIEVSWRSRRRTSVTATRELSATEERVPAVPTPVAVCLISLDDHPLIEHDQVLQPGKVYTLSIEVRGTGWPAWAATLELELLSDVNADELTRPRFEFARPSDLAEDADYQLAASGPLIVRFTLPPGRPAVPVRVAGVFSSESHRSAEVNGVQRTALNVAGHPQVRLRPFDPSRDGSTTYPQVDGRLLELFARLQGRFPDDQVEAFARFMTAIALASGQIQFDQAYRLGTRVTEAEFHNDLEARLLRDESLGGRVTRRNARSGGFLDLDHDQITAELKVERDTPVTRENCARYLGQPTQYATGANKRLSILVVLDMSRKVSPPGTLENYVWLMEPSLHGLTDPAYPSIVGVLVINANNRVPSGYAGRRIEAKVAETPSGDRGAV